MINCTANLSSLPMWTFSRFFNNRPPSHAPPCSRHVSHWCARGLTCAVDAFVTCAVNWQVSDRKSEFRTVTHFEPEGGLDSIVALVFLYISVVKSLKDTGVVSALWNIIRTYTVISKLNGNFSCIAYSVFVACAFCLNFFIKYSFSFHSVLDISLDLLQ